MKTSEVAHLGFGTNQQSIEALGSHHGLRCGGSFRKLLIGKTAYRVFWEFHEWSLNRFLVDES
jgi:hypothetical protein